jgi:hypothetical protein
MYSIALLIVELQTARRKLQEVLETPNAAAESEFPSGVSR